MFINDSTMAQPGFIFALTEGEYSDYRINGFVKVLKLFSPYKLIETYKETPGYDRYEFGQAQAFVAWMIREGYIEPVDDQIGTWYLGSYGELD